MRTITASGKAAAILLGALALSGCADKWDRPALGIDAPGRWKDDSESRPVWPAADWWRGFGSAELTRLIEEAERSNQDIAQAKARIEQADAQVRINGASLIPLISTSGDSSLQRSAGSSRLIGGLQAQGSASYEIDFWGKNRANVISAKASALSSRFGAEVIALSTVTSVADTYFALMGAQERLAIARGNVKSAQTIFDAIQARVEVGTASALDRAQQRSVLDQQKATIPSIEQEIRTNETALALLLGRPPVRVDIKGGRLATLKTPKVAPGIPSQVLARRPDVREAEANLTATDADVTAARAAFLPSFNLTAQGGFESVALRTLFSSQSTFYSLGAGLTQPILNPQLPGNLDLAKGQYRENLFAYRQTTIQSFVDVENALISVRKTTEQERLQQAAVKSAREAYDIAQAQLREGAVDITTVLTTQQTLFSAQDTLVNVRLSRFQAIVSMFSALGGGWAASGKPPGAGPVIAAATAGAPAR
ncbi:NodT family efflux transporter outer membrane factor (OMF) lipoprotein [Methylopila capsulata]|uniref:NodT family efflux transporter outer membrane factor (OMF) lipoprotein n=1 Tax=Methylopila capsulata TaxID=61654 RepID=A0A9W6MRG2_9HYPH|nr:efflux transporter outer membrane subunit [Methylopila capsulata]MBM7849834.1 NodT family efflux transporter outer membrane factor (OMF) lipoprotein [Methylopila capsulata]GLK55124.1 RND transporter [Methylopila capsulata]